MRHFLPSFVCILLISFAAQAQDLAIVSIYPANETIIKAGTSRTIALRISPKEHVAQGTKFGIKYRLNGGSTLTADDALYTDATPVGKLMPPVAVPVTFPNQPDDTMRLEIFLDFADDKNHANDTIRAEYILKKSVENDLAVRLLQPHNHQVMTVDSSYQFEISIKNVGSNAVATNSSMVFYINYNGAMQQPQIYTYTQAALQPGDSFLLSRPISFQAEDINTDAQLCVAFYLAQLTDTALVTIEGNYSDNQSCATVSVVPSSINSIKPQARFMASYYNGNLILQDVNMPENASSIAIKLYNLQGQLIMQQSVNPNLKSLSLACPTLRNGIYIVQCSGENGLHTERKIVVEN
ncbi:T9SS type A sorting domain-containing protein [bacterium]|nr:T9SS type A sorting domain-containing protein [bacterium]